MLISFPVFSRVMSSHLAMSLVALDSFEWYFSSSIKRAFHDSQFAITSPPLLNRHTPIEMITRMWDWCCTAFFDGSLEVVVWHSFFEQSNIKRDGGTSAT